MKHAAFPVAVLLALALTACGGEQAADDNENAVGEATPDATAESPDTQSGSSDADTAELGEWGFDLSAMKPGVDPGDDFFRYANGQWLEEFAIPDDESRWGSFDELRERSRERVRSIVEEMADAEPEKGSIEQKIGDFYGSYMDEETVNDKGLDPLRPVLEEIASVSSAGELLRLMGQAQRRNLAGPISGYVGIDRKNPDRYMLNISHSGLGLPDRSYYLEDSERFDKIREAYRAHIAEVLAMAGMDNGEAMAENIHALEKAIAEKHWPREELRNRDKTYNLYTIENLDEEFPALDWSGYLEAAGVPVSEIDELNVTTPDAINPLAAMLEEQPLETWKAYLTFHAISNHADVLSQDFYDEHFSFFGQTLSGQPEQKPRWKRAIEEIGGARGGLGEAIGRVYVQRHFPPEAKQQMEALVENLRAAFRKRLERIEWMGAETKEEAFAKLETFNPKIGYPDEWRDFSDLEIVEGHLMANVRNVREFFYEDQISRLTEPADKDEWFMSPQTVNAYYNPSWNEIVFPAGILQPPFFDPDADPAVNYGGIGGVIGHEMGHGFDDQGSKSDAQGVQRNWWTDADRERFEERTRALVEQYDQYAPIEGQTVNGQLTLGENIGDLGGLSIALEAYRISLDGEEAPVLDGYTGTQRLFLGWAQVWQGKYREQALLRRLKSDPHSPPEFRVNGVVRNMDAWYEAFDVSEDDELHLPPEERVSIW